MWPYRSRRRNLDVGLVLRGQEAGHEYERDSDADAVRSISDADAFAALSAERAVVTALGGGCQLPLGAVAVLERDSLSVHVIVASPNGRDAIRQSIRGPIDRAAALGQQLAEELEAAGAGEILTAVRSGATP